MEDNLETYVSVCELTSGIIDEKEWKEELDKDSELTQVKISLLTNKMNDSSLSKTWRLVFDELSVDKGILLRGNKLICPVSLRKKLIEEAHQGHLGIVKTKERLRSSFWWPGMDLEIEREVREHLQCRVSDKVLSPRTLPMVCRRLPNAPWQDVAMDIVGPLSGEKSTPYLLVLIDLYSRWVEVSCVRSDLCLCDLLFERDLSERGFP